MDTLEIGTDHDLTALGLLSQLHGAADEIASAIAAAGAGAREYQRLTWDASLHKSWKSGRAAQGFTVWNDGSADAYVGLSSADVSTPFDGAILTVRAGTWLTLPITSSHLYVGGASAGTLLVFAFDHAPNPAGGNINAASLATTVGGADSGGTARTFRVDSGGGVTTAQPAVSVAAEFTRPADTTAYAALDVVADSTSAPTVLTFAGMARLVAGYGMVVKAQLLTDQKTNTARYRLHLFTVAPTAINDNSPYLALYANRANRVGTIDFPAAATEDPSNSTTAIAQQLSTVLPFVCAAADTALYGILETLDAFTPANAQKFYVKLTAEQG